MDRHFLSPLFAPRSMVVFAGDPEAETAPTPMAGTLRRALREGGFAGPLTWLDIGMSGTLGDLAQSRSDLALIALPPEQIAAALEVVGRIRCRAALVLSSGVSLALASELHAIAQRAGV
ncbi:MAG: GNAT family N-acetyltransferase, partial [Burkholderiales bacterium]|nr:GNAT family N-acetyltransferase [Burkholderiales bacterium]